MMPPVPSAAGSPWAPLWRAARWLTDPLGVGQGPVSPANGLRAGIIFLVPFLLALPADTLDGSTNVGIAGLLVTLTDVGGPRRVRVTVMLLSTVWVTVAVVLGVLVGVGPLWLQVLLLVVLISGVTTWSAIGAIGTTAALAATLAAVSGLAYQDSTVAWETGVQFAIGGAWAIAVALAMPWVNPERLALRRTQAAFATVADHLEAVRGAGRTTAAATEAAAAQALRAARGAIAGLGNRGGTVASNRMLLLLREASRTMEDAERLDRDPAAAGGGDLLRASAEALRAVGLSVTDENAAVGVERLNAAIAELPPTRDGAVEGAIARRVAATAHEGFVWDAALLPLRGMARGDTVGASPVAREMRRFALLRSLFSPRSMVFRYAVRLGVAVGLSYGIGVAINPDFGQLAAVGALPVLQPNVGGTLREGVKHAISVLVLVAVAAGIVMVVHSPDALSVIATAMVVGVFALERMSFGAFVVLLAPLAVIVAAIYDPEHDSTILQEVGFAMLGAVIAIVVGYLVFRRDEDRALPAQVAAALGTARAYLAGALDPASSPEAVARARVEAEIGRINAAAALMRAQGERHLRLDDPEPLETALASDAELIDAAAVVRASGADPGAAGAWADAALAGLEEAAGRGQAPDPLPPRPDVSGTDAVNAVVRAVEGIDDAMRRFARGAAARPA